MRATASFEVSIIVPGTCLAKGPPYRSLLLPVLLNFMAHSACRRCVLPLLLAATKDSAAGHCNPTRFPCCHGISISTPLPTSSSCHGVVRQCGGRAPCARWQLDEQRAVGS